MSLRLPQPQVDPPAKRLAEHGALRIASASPASTRRSIEARLRKTLRMSLEANGSYLEAAARMHVHKNTVRYRVRKAEETPGRLVTDGRLAIEVALLACDQLAATTKTAIPQATQPTPRARS